MNNLIVVSGILLILFIVFQSYTTLATKKSVTQPYTVIRKEKDFEIRFYPSYTLAVITSTAKTYKQLGSSGFRRLASYIFGGNKDNKQIGMTSPVHMEINDTISSMSFVMPAIYNKDNLPLPNNSDIAIKTISSEYVAAIKFGGFASQETILDQTELLKKILNKNNISYFGHFRYLGYNPPYQIFGRRNEIIVALNWDKKINGL
jgi:hypothetical protein